MSNEAKYTYFRMDFKDCACFDFDYTIVPDLDEVMRIMKVAEMDLDDDTGNASVTITGIGLTHNEYRHWQKENKEQ